MSSCDSSASIDRWLGTDESQEVIRDISMQLPLSAKAIQRLRADWGQARAHALLSVADLRKSSLSKLGISLDSHHTPLATPRALQQSTDHFIATYKARRISGTKPVLDICCGLGGDAIALSHHRSVIMVDRDPQMCRFAAFNVGTWGGSQAVAWCTEAESIEVPEGVWIHVDPDRRLGEQRTSQVFCSQPNEETIRTLVDQSEGACVKLAPAAQVPEDWDAASQREWISSKGECRQQVVWFEQQNTQTRRATCVTSDGNAYSFQIAESELEDARCNSAGNPQHAWLFDFDPAVRAAGLSGAFAAHLNLRSIGSPAGFFSATDIQSNKLKPYGKLLHAFGVVWAGKWRESHVASQLASLGTSSLEIKIRGLDLQPEKLRGRLLRKRKRARTADDPTSSSAGNHVLLLGVDGNKSAYAAICDRVEMPLSS